MGQTLSEPIVDKTSKQDSNDKYAYGSSAMQGWRITMEDAHVTILDLDNTGSSFFAVYDGHGGATVAQYTGENLHNKIRNSTFFDKKMYKEALKDGFMSIDEDLSKDSNFAYDPAGCTAVTALVTPDRRIFVANAGDSRSIISIKGKSKPLSYDHKPVDRIESQRITAAGGFVEFGRVNGNLALSRAIGDFEFKQNENLSAEEQIVTCNPDIIEHQLTDEDEFFVLACDGIWDCLTNQQVVDYIRKEAADRVPLHEICESIMDHCLADESDLGSVGCDNMSIVIVAILNGRTLDEWYDWMATRVSKQPKKDALGNDVSSDSEEDEEDEEEEEGEAVPVVKTEATGVPAKDAVAEKDT